jgi:prepilin-type processing-associated H-X9-DG protein
LSEAASTIFLLTPGNQAADHLIGRLVFSDPLNRWVEADLKWREQANALIEPSRWIYVFGKWTKNRLLGQMTATNRVNTAFFDGSVTNAGMEGATDFSRSQMRLKSRICVFKLQKTRSIMPNYRYCGGTRVSSECLQQIRLNGQPAT